ncbi:PilN domain-containing protein [Flavobacterium sp. HTF]|uniref:PilN domain-containing protein n=1 Tax=Flavobacterium sp. HTF TaxID=2170732 RepID=UPI000D5D6DFE|nr:PilN domain-containing protein [Flavobacterium sp. HTF]PWB21472.1 general secretion pathway protein [Flavobacterium sp. HTF]
MTFPSITSLLLGKEYIGIEHFTLNNEEKIAVLLVEEKKEGLVISKKDRVSYNQKIAEKWDVKLPFFLILNTNQVIQKEVPSVETSDDKLLHKAFPNTNWEDFYFEIWRLKTKSIIAITRKTYLDEIVNQYEKQKIKVAGISLGVCALAEIFEYVNESQIFTNNQAISKHEDQQIISANILEFSINYNINDLEIENRHLLVFSGILRLILNTSPNSGSVISYSEELRDDYNQKHFFAKGLKIIIAVVLGILLLNFIFFTHYYKLAQETTETVLVNKSSLEDITKIKRRIIVKEEKVKNSVGKTDSQSSLLINEIAKEIPSSILLTELSFNPLEKKIKAEEAVLATNKVITITGTTLSNEDFTNWIESIEKKRWIDKVLITHFGKNDTNETEFSIKITLK